MPWTEAGVTEAGVAGSDMYSTTHTTFTRTLSVAFQNWNAKKSSEYLVNRIFMNSEDATLKEDRKIATKTVKHFLGLKSL